MLEQPPYYLLERRVSPSHRATLGLVILKAMQQVPDAIGHFEARKPSGLHVTSLSATEFRRVVHSRQRDAIIKKLPHQTWETALSTKIAKLPGNCEPLQNVFIGSIMLLGPDKNLVTLSLHNAQLEAESSQSVALGAELGGVLLNKSRAHVTLGRIDGECDTRFLEAIRALTPHTLDLDPRQVRAVPAGIIEQRIQERAIARSAAA